MICGRIRGLISSMNIDDWRKKIDEIDLEMVRLMNQRSRCAIEIGKIKEKRNIDVYDPKREQQVLQNVQGVAKGPMSREAMKRLFERIIDESRRAEREHRQKHSPRRSTRKSTK